MKKTLTVSIAAYNVENYLRQTLDSCIVPEVMDELEVLIVSDGATDGTVAIGKEYEAKYPNTFRVIEKKNGGYGSTVNRSMSEATGKYFRLLDGDDWFDKEGLAEYIRSLRESEADYVINRIYTCQDGTDIRTLSDPHWGELEGSTQNIRDIHCEFTIGIWHTTVKTEILKQHPFTLPEHTLYTDQIFIMRTMPYVHTVQFEFTPLYCYRVGRDGQSVSRESRIKHADEEMKVVAAQVKYLSTCGELTADNKEAVMSRATLYYYYGIVTLLLMPPSWKTYRRIRGFEKRTKELMPELYRAAGKYSKKIAGMRLTGYPGYLVYAGKVENFH